MIRSFQLPRRFDEEPGYEFYVLPTQKIRLSVHRFVKTKKPIYYLLHLVIPGLRGMTILRVTGSYRKI